MSNQNDELIRLQNLAQELKDLLRDALIEFPGWRQRARELLKKI